MARTLHYHPLSSCCHKVLIALYELDVPFDRQLVDLGDPAGRAAFQELSPMGKMPVLVEDGAVVPETSIIIEHLQRQRPEGPRLLPSDPDAVLQVRLWDRLLDLYVMAPMQAVVADHLRPPAQRDPVGVTGARRTLETAYERIDSQLAQRSWIVGDAFSMADCAAAPALFYAATLVPFDASQARLADYLAHLLRRPSVARVLDEARPYFKFYPFHDALPPEYRG